MSQKVKISISELQEGLVCASEVAHESGDVLLSSGVQLNAEFLHRLASRGISHVLLTTEDAARLADTKARLKSKVSRGSERNMANARESRADEPYSEERAQRFTSRINSAINFLEDLGTNSWHPSSLQMSELSDIPESMASMLLEDSDQMLCNIADHDEASRSLAKRCSMLSLLAMSTALELQCTDEEVLQVGKAGLLHDLSLFTMPAHFRDSSRTLTFDELEQYRTHPERSATMLQDVDAVNEIVKLLILQVHELPNGQGYPRGVKLHRFHGLTKILSAVEIYLALIHPGPGRPAVVPHDAIAFMLHQCRYGTVEADVMRALINQLSLFPIGTQVRLSDGSLAVISRRNKDAYDAPMIRVGDDITSPLVSLASREVNIVSPVPHAWQMRIGGGLMGSLSIDEMILNAAS